MASATHLFVTGGTGLIGRALVKRLLRRGLDVTLMIRSGAAERRKSVLEDLDTAEFLNAGAEGQVGIAVIRGQCQALLQLLRGRVETSIAHIHVGDGAAGFYVLRIVGQ